MARFTSRARHRAQSCFVHSTLCRQPGADIQRVTTGLSFRYSSREAQKADWNAGHKIECKNWQQLRASGAKPGHVPNSLVRLLCRTLWKRERELKQTQGGATFWRSFDAVASLVDNTAESSGMDANKRMLHQYVADTAMCVPFYVCAPACTRCCDRREVL